MEEERPGRLFSIMKRRKMKYDLLFLKEFKTEDCEQIDLGQNFIQDLSLLVGMRFDRLIILNLSVNLIASLQPFRRVQMPVLEVLDLHGNSIQEGGPLVECGLQRLKELKLGCQHRGNEIEDLNFIARSKWAYLEALYLDSNNIIKIQPMKRCSSFSLTHLYLGNNQISSIDPTLLINFEHLKVLSLRHNHLTSLGFLSKSHLPFIEFINLGGNNISSINTLPKSDFPKLSKLSLVDNSICWLTDLFKCNFRPLSTVVQPSYSTVIYRSVVEGQLYQKLMINKESE